jgi:putative FmdB family regulatory protein
MPIYAYKCGSCGHAKDVLQKLSDAPLTDCPACGASSFSKQLTAAGFQLKGSGWYVTDFRGGSGAAAPASADGKPAEGKPAEGKPAESKPADGGTKSETAAATPSKSSDAPSASAGGGCGASCACH